MCDREVTGVAMGLSPPEDLCENSNSYSSPNSCQAWADGCWGWDYSALEVPQLAGESHQEEFTVHAFGGFRVRIVWSAGSAVATVSLLPGTMAGTG